MGGAAASVGGVAPMPAAGVGVVSEPGVGGVVSADVGLAAGSVGGVAAALGVVSEPGVGGVVSADVGLAAGSVGGVAAALGVVSEPGVGGAVSADVGLAAGSVGGVAAAPGVGLVGGGPSSGCGSGGVAMPGPLFLRAGHPGAVERRDVAQHPGGGLHERHRERGAGPLAKPHIQVEQRPQA